jgi:hypothetical protein
MSLEWLRRATVPQGMVLPDGRKIEFRKMKSSPFGSMKEMG